MKIVKIIAMIFLSLILIASGFIYQIIMGVNMTITDDVFINTTIKESKIIKEAHEYFIKQMPITILESNLGRKIKIDDKEFEIDYEKYSPLVANSFGRAFSSSWLEQNVYKIVTDVTNYIKGDSKRIDTVLDLRKNKQELRVLLIDDFKKIAKDYGLDHYLGPSDIEGTIDNILRRGEFPDEIRVDDFIPKTIHENLKQILELKKYFTYIPFIAFGLIAIIMMIINNPGKGLIWFGGGIISSFLAFFIAIWFFGGKLYAQAIQITNKTIVLSPFTTSVIFDRIIYKLRVSAGLFALIGLIFFIVGMAINIRLTSEMEDEYD